MEKIHFPTKAELVIEEVRSLLQVPEGGGNAPVNVRGVYSDTVVDSPFGPDLEARAKRADFNPTFRPADLEEAIAVAEEVNDITDNPHMAPLKEVRNCAWCPPERVYSVVGTLSRFALAAVRAEEKGLISLEGVDGLAVLQTVSAQHIVTDAILGMRPPNSRTDKSGLYMSPYELAGLRYDFPESSVPKGIFAAGVLEYIRRKQYIPRALELLRDRSNKSLTMTEVFAHYARHEFSPNTPSI